MKAHSHAVGGQKSFPCRNAPFVSCLSGFVRRIAWSHTVEGPVKPDLDALGPGGFPVRANLAAPVLSRLPIGGARASPFFGMWVQPNNIFIAPKSRSDLGGRKILGLASVVASWLPGFRASWQFAAWLPQEGCGGEGPPAQPLAAWRLADSSVGLPRCLLSSLLWLAGWVG